MYSRFSVPMSSSNGTQIHPTGVDYSKSPSRESSPLKLPTSQDSTGAWQEKNGTSSKTLGHSVNVKVSSYTSGFSSEEEESDVEETLSTPKGMTRSLGRAEMHGLKGAQRYSIASVSERLAAYKELVSQSNKESPRHSSMKLSDGSDSSPVQSRIELNPFFQLDKQGKLLPCQPEKRRGTTPGRFSTRPGDREKSSSSSPSHVGEMSPRHYSTRLGEREKSASSSPSHGSPDSSPIGMSVQMRIKVWAEKEEKETSSKHTKLMHRRSLQPISMLAVESREVSDSTSKAVSHSDDEAIMTKNTDSPAKYVRPPRENAYEEIRDDHIRVKEASSSSEASPSPSPSSTPVRSSKLQPPKSDQAPAASEKRSKWRIRSPIPKRKHKISSPPSEAASPEHSKSKGSPQGSPKKSPPNKASKRTTYNRKTFRKKKSTSRDGSVDEVFSSKDQESDDFQKKSEEDPFSPQLEELPSIFDKVSDSPARSKCNSISGDIRNIIDAFGTVGGQKPDNIPCPAISVEGREDSGLDSGKSSCALGSSATSKWCQADSLVRGNTLILIACDL